jgi:DNA-binding MarR family transcriptional regulator
LKKEKKKKKLDVKESKKDLKKKMIAEEKNIDLSESSSPKTEMNIETDSLKKLMEDSAVLYQNILSLPQTFNIGSQTYSLYSSELKSLDMIGHFPGINLTQLAVKLGISKSAISKCTSKLLEKELIVKEKSLTNVREVVFTFTKNGQSVFDQLESVHDRLFSPVTAALKSFSTQETTDLYRLFTVLHTSLTEINDSV